jgi:4-hydroxybenzoate polyprenyltransferase
MGVAALQVLWHLRWIADRSREGCFRAFRANHWVGAAAFAGGVIDLAGR